MTIADTTAEPRWRRTITFGSVTSWVLRIGITAILVFGIAASVLKDRYSADQWVDLIAFGITIGSVYALIALGYTMVYGVLRLINFAHGDIMMAGSFAGYFVAASLDRSGALNAHPVLAFAAILAVAMVVSAGIAVLTERLAYRPFRYVRGLAPLICAIGVSFFLQQSFRGFFGAGLRSYPDPAWLRAPVSLLGFNVPAVQVLVVASALIVMLGLYIIVHKTSMGTAMRAVSEDVDTATLMGVDVNKVVTFTFALGGAVGGIAGVLFGLVFKQVYFFMGFTPGIKAFGAAVLGGIGNLPGAMIGGIFLGLCESLGPSLLLDGLGVPAPYQMRDLIAFTLLIAVLIFRPYGLFGERLTKKKG
ncbi:branched-chain amino acid ABC transporter permease [Starkeya sp. ORNL1]|uniref:branched-chain amino acid ABC transporter permease n=1 Tax=Starkeya sp. ORNL1 TaxID=2709380 RepID=UPI0014631904|nr:branched-chain amino acid ABC transporter permease [Starkeya sp. ORNL1]QJP15796.1 branched-chain amino acid ABC transporter permease [Starkeya sp. ORNL1]